MAVTYEIPERVDQHSVLLRWSSDRTPPVTFRLYREGRKIYEVTSADGTGEFVLAVADGDQPFVEVLDVACANPSLAFPGRFTLVWLSVSGAASYRIDEYVSAAWTTRQTITADGSSSYRWQSRWLEDSQQHQFRVVPISTAGNGGTPTTITALMVRHPDAPSVTYAYNGSATPTVTVTSA